LALTFAEREEISRALVAGFSIPRIAMLLGRAPSTVSREIKRNGRSCPRSVTRARACADRRSVSA
jgi:IS30 family transposase